MQEVESAHKKKIKKEDLFEPKWSVVGLGGKLLGLVGISIHSTLLIPPLPPPLPPPHYPLLISDTLLEITLY